MRTSHLLQCILIIALLLSGCTASQLPPWIPFSSVEEDTPVPEQTSTPTSIAPDLNVTPTTTTVYQTLVVWLPPFLNPDRGSIPATLLATHLENFEMQYQDLNVEIRIKAEDGTGGLMNSLITASVSAPMALPSLALMRQEDLETAVKNGVILPLEVIPLIDPDWFPYAKEMSLVNGVVYGLPFYGDALALLHRPLESVTPPNTWQEFLDAGEVVVFPAALENSLLTFDLYLATGTPILGENGQPAVQQEPLEEIFGFYETASRRGVFAPWMTQLETDQQSWDAYQSGRANHVITWTSRYLADPNNALISPLPSLEGQPYTLATGWLWVLTDPLPERRENSKLLAEYLVDSAFLVDWSPLARSLPVRPSSVSGWRDQSLQSEISVIAQSAHALPPSSVIDLMGPKLKDITIQVIKLQLPPGDAASQALETLDLP